MGKKKYINFRIANRDTVSEGVKLDNCVNYKDLSEIIRSVDIGNVQHVRPTLAFNYNDEPDGEQNTHRDCQGLIYLLTGTGKTSYMCLSHLY